MNAAGGGLRLGPRRGGRWVAPAAIVLAVALVAGAAWIAFRDLDAQIDLHTAGPAWLMALGKAAGLAAALLLMLQFALSARLGVLDRAFGLDRLLRAHRAVGAAAAVLACCHPFLLYGPGVCAIGPARWDVWPELLGAGVLVAVWLIVCTSIWRVFLLLDYRAWRWIHQLVFVAAVGATVHGLERGSDLAAGWTRLAWWVILAAYAALGAWVKLVKPLLLRRRRYTVAEVRRLSHNICRIELTPPAGRGPRHLPGQFAFLRLIGQAVSSQEHPFTISSAPRADGTVALTIKASGDYTETVDRVRPGEKAVLDGPYGRFSYLLGGRAAGGLLLIAGGVGATPMLSMIRHLAETEPDRPVTFIWSNRARQDIFAADELEQLSGRMPNLRVHHVLTRQPDWDGPAGRLDEQMLRRLAGDVRQLAAAFVCGPPSMMDGVSAALGRLGLPRRRIHTERFAL